MPNNSAVRKQAPESAEPWMTVRQAALALDCAPQTVYSKAAKGDLEIMWVAKRAFISRASVEAAVDAARA